MMTDNIPQLLKDRANWVVYSLTNKPKAPRSVESPGFPADPTDPTNWAEFDAAVECVDLEPVVDGIGFALRQADSIVCFDFDHCLKDGQIVDERVARAVQLLDSYTEISPSGDGLHVWCNASDVGRLHINKGWFEIYNDEKYVTVTGNVFGEPKDITPDFRKVVRGVIADLLKADTSGSPDEPANTDQKVHHAPVDFDFGASGQLVRIDGDELFNGDATLCRLWGGDYSHTEGKDESAADMSMASLLVAGGYEDQPIMDLIIARRMRNKEDLHERNLQKYTRTIGKARQSAPAAQLRNERAAAGEQLRDMEAQEPTDESREEARIAFSRMLSSTNIEVDRIEKLGKKVSLYRVFFRCQRIDNSRDIGSARDFRNKNVWMDLMMDYSMSMPAFPTGEGSLARWNEMIGAVMLHLVEEDSTYKSSVSDRVKLAIEGKIAKFKNEHGQWVDTDRDAIAGAAIAYHEGSVWVHLESLTEELGRKIKDDAGRPLRTQHVGPVLYELGSEKPHRSRMLGGNVNLWRIPV